MTMHRVEQGQRLSEIAEKYGTSTEEIVRANPAKEAITLPSGKQVFASLAAGEDIELPGVLGAAESDYPRRFYEQAFDALHATLSMDLKSQETLDKVAQAASYMKSAVTYLETHTLTSSKYASQLDAVVYAKGILLNIDTLDDILTGKAIFHAPANYYALLADTLGRLGAEMDKWPKPASSSLDLLFSRSAWKAAQTKLPPTSTFPTDTSASQGAGAGTKVPSSDPVSWGGPIKVKLGGEEICAEKGLRFNATTGLCVSADGSTSDPFAGTATTPSTAPTCPAGTWWKESTQSCVPNDSQAELPFGGDSKLLAEARERAYQEDLAKQRAAAAAASSSTKKKVLIVAGSVLALGLAGFGAWHMLAKDKAEPEKKPAP